MPRSAKGFHIIARCPDEARHQWFKACLYLAVAGGAERGQRTAVERSFKHYDGRLLNAAFVPVQPCQFDGRFIGFSAGVAEEAVLHVRYLCQGSSELLLRLDAIEIGTVHQLVGLASYGRSHCGVGVPQPIHSNSGNAIQVAPSLGIIEVHALAVTECHR